MADRPTRHVETAIATTDPTDLTALTHWTSGQIDIIKRQIAPKCSDDELVLFAQVCKRSGLDPFARQIYAVSRWDKQSNSNKMAIQTGIDGFRLIAERTGCYAGSDEPLFDEGLNLYQSLQSDRKTPTSVKVLVWKMVQGHRCSFAGVAAWEQFVQVGKEGRPNSMWARMPHNMLAKCAEAQALRKAFPAELSGLTLEGAERDPFGGDRTPVDYLESDVWYRFQAAMQTAASIHRAQKCVDHALKLIEKGELPAIARNGIERELEIVQQRFRDAIAFPSKAIASSSQSDTKINPKPVPDAVQDSIFNPLLEQANRVPIIDAIKSKLREAKTFPQLQKAILWTWQPQQIGQISEVPAMLASVNGQIRSLLLAAIQEEFNRLKWTDVEKSQLLQKEFKEDSLSKLKVEELLKATVIAYKIPTPPLSEEEERAQMDLALGKIE